MSPTALEPLVGTPKDPEILWELRIDLLEQEVQRLHRHLGRAYARIAELEGRDPQLAFDELLEELRKSEAERLRREQAQVQADEKAEEKPVKPRPPRRGHGPRPQEALPVVETVFELEEGTTCKVCGGHPEPLGDQFEESEEIDVIERQYVRRVLRRRKYRCRCNACVMTAPASPRVLPGGRYSTDFTVQVVVDKYLDAIPLERQARIMEREGLQVDSQTLFDQAWAACQHLRPVYDAPWAVWCSKRRSCMPTRRAGPAWTQRS